MMLELLSKVHLEQNHKVSPYNIAQIRNGFQVFENASADYSKNHSSENLTMETNKDGTLQETVTNSEAPTINALPVPQF